MLWPVGLLWSVGLSWRAGLPRVGLRSSPNKAECGVSGIFWLLIPGLLRGPTRGKPARHSKPVRHNESAP
ncbi:hypothetical protein C1Y18_33520 [Pseudomonas sp. MPR-R5A]|nr:hypothetical protein C1Y25_29455 [Pseudomonas sp. MPBC4-3]PMX38704.1 hypothetical protein C1Y20_32920 [Pseudomonas sp. FW301-21B01]PMY01656.1 hypothetical protein C1Y18_33520 [Pseudomonas sp. MPR-R5A]PNA65871.1 hypothetical protein C1Y14_22215 [Pseudomonas sp. MPR-R5B]